MIALKFKTWIVQKYHKQNEKTNQRQGENTTIQIYKEILQTNKNKPKCINVWPDDRNKPFK